jgi:hypothetical protein
MRRRLEARRHADVDRYARGKQPAIRITATGANDSIAALDAAQRQLRELAKPIKREVKK